MNLDLEKFETGAKHFGNAMSSLMVGLAHFVQAAAPVAEAVGMATGNPEVALGAKVAEGVATAVTKAHETDGQQEGLGPK